MTKIIKFLEQITNQYIMILSIFIFIFFIIIVLPNEQERSFQMTGESRSPDTSFFYTANELYEIALDYGEEGRQYYIQSRFTFDLVWPLAYTSFLVFTPLFIFKKLKLDKQKLILFALLAMLFDILENTFASIVMARYPSHTPIIAHMTPIFTMLKWVTLGFAFIIFGYSLILLIVHTFNLFKKKLKNNMLL